MIRVIGEIINSIAKNANEAPSSTSAKTIKRSFVKINDIPQIYSERINEIVLNEEISKPSIFIGGEFNIDYTDEKSYKCSYVLYFQDKSGESYEIKAGSKPLDITRLEPESAKELESQKTIKFDIPEMSEEVRGNYKVTRK